MVRAEITNKAIIETLKYHPDFRPLLTTIIIGNAIPGNGVNLINFTKKNGIRNKIKNADNMDFINFINHQICKIYNTGVYYYNKNEPGRPSFDTYFPNFSTIVELYDYISDNKIISPLYLATSNLNLSVAGEIVSMYYQNDAMISLIDKYGLVCTNSSDINLFDKLDSDVSIIVNAGYSNIKVCYGTVERCKKHLIENNGAVLNSTRNYSLDNKTFSYIEKGQTEKQQDGTIIYEHPSNSRFRLLAVADGIGEFEKSDEVSREILLELTNWFEKIALEVFYHPDALKNMLNNKIESINESIYQKYKAQAGASLTVAIVADDSTIVSSVGNSRCFLNRNNYTELLTRDDTVAWDLEYVKGEVDINKLPFHPYAKVLRKFIGCYNLQGIESHIIKNISYKHCILITNGGNGLSTDTIHILCSNTPSDVIPKLLASARYNRRLTNAHEDYNNIYRPENNNSTVAVHVGGR